MRFTHQLIRHQRFGRPPLSIQSSGSSEILKLDTQTLRAPGSSAPSETFERFSWELLCRRSWAEAKNTKTSGSETSEAPRLERSEGVLNIQWCWNQGHRKKFLYNRGTNISVKVLAGVQRPSSRYNFNTCIKVEKQLKGTKASKKSTQTHLSSNIFSPVWEQLCSRRSWNVLSVAGTPQTFTGRSHSNGDTQRKEKKKKTFVALRTVEMIELDLKEKSFSTGGNIYKDVYLTNRCL